MAELAPALQHAMLTVFLVAGPLLGAIMAVGIAVSLFQAATQLNELTLSFVPKFLATGAVLILLGPWLLRQLEVFAVAMLGALARGAS